MRKKEKIEIIGIMCVYNEELNLAQCLKHLEKYVDKFVIYDDGSFDKTIEILKTHPKVVKVICSNNNKKDRKWKERANRKLVLNTAYSIAETKNPWVFCLDPDERCEIRFLKNLRKIAYKYNNQNKLIYFHFRELWDNYKIYRIDGIWNQKRKGIFFQLAKKMTFDYDQEYHIPWAYREILNNEVNLDYNIYHLKMIKAEERQQRRNLYNKLDPLKKMQAIGYDYLVDTSDIKLKKISYFKRYDYKTIDNYYKEK